MDTYLSSNTPSSGSADTIVALSTSAGTGAIGIVRMSGPEAITLAQRVFRPAKLGAPLGQESHRLHYGHVTDAGGRPLDEVLVAVMRSPSTYTREDVVEIHCHGGLAAQRAVLRLLVLLGARPAEPGEFTRRAFLNGRIDLAQAEAVAAVVQARSTAALRAAVSQLEGGLSERVRELRQRLVSALAELEATIDFSDEDIDDVDRNSVCAQLTEVGSSLEKLVSTAFLGRVLEQGVRTAIVGKPNVGKSSLLNALLMRERAIVSEIPGTTRDTVEELVELAGMPLHLIDTAGMRSGAEHIEQLGIERSRQALRSADLVLAVFDLSSPPEAEDRELLAELDPARSVLVGNKVDLKAGWPSERVHASQGKGADRPQMRAGEELLEVSRGGNRESLAGWAGGADLAAVFSEREDRDPLSGGGENQGADGHGLIPPWVSSPYWASCQVSALTGEGLDELRAAMEASIVGRGAVHLDEPLLATERQRLLVERAVVSVGAATEGLIVGAGDELIAEDLRDAISSLGTVTGEELVPDLLDEVFRRFCIGK